MFTNQKSYSTAGLDILEALKKILIVFSLVVIQLSIFSSIAYQSPSRLSNKGAWRILSEMGYDMNSIPLKDYGNGLCGISTNSIAFTFLCDSEGYPVACKIECPKSDIMTMMIAMHTFVWKSSGVDIINGEYLNEKAYQAIMQRTTVDIWLPETHAIYHFQGDFTEQNSNIMRLVILRELR